MGAIVGTGLYLDEERDEFQRNLLVQSLLGALVETLKLSCTIWGYLEDFKPRPRILDLVLVYPMFWVLASISYGLIWRRYR